MAHRVFRLSLAAACAGVLSGLSAAACSGASDGAGDGGTGNDAGGRPHAKDGGQEREAEVDGGRPSLIELRVTESTTAAELKLYPPFSTDVRDYYVRCGAGTSALDVTMVATPGSVSLLVAPASSPSKRRQTVSVDVMESQAIVAEAANGVDTSEYWVRCLPHDFPTLVWTPHAEAGLRRDGYYLVGNTPVASGEGGYAMILNKDGVPLWYRRAASGESPFDVDSLETGAISFTSSPGEHPFQVVHPKTGKTFVLARADEHELRSLGNGKYLIIRQPTLRGIDLTGLFVPSPDGGLEPLGPDSTILGCQVAEVDAARNVTWEWDVMEHLDPVKDSTFPEVLSGAKVGGGGHVVDPFHCNSVDIDPSNGNLLVSARNTDSVVYVDRATGAILWKMGGAPFTKDGAAYVPVADAFHRQHDARLQPGFVTDCSGARGRVSMFDDETETRSAARAVLYDVTVDFGEGAGVDAGTDGGRDASADAGTDASSDGDTDTGSEGGMRRKCHGSPPSSATVTWQYKGTAPSVFLGSFRISADGSHVVGWGFNPNQPTFTEVDVAGHDLLDFAFDPGVGNTSYRAIKLGTAEFDLNVLHATAGQP